jgi:hypothetical protein
MDMKVLYFQLLFFPLPRVCGCTKLGAIFGWLSIGFLASKCQAKRPEFQRFVRQIYHTCLAWVFAPLKAGMTKPEVVLCPDGHFRCTVHSLGPYIADYPEQVWLASIVQGWCLKYVNHFIYCLIMLIVGWSNHRCDAQPENLDNKAAHCQSHERSNFIIPNSDPGIIWLQHGIQSDVIVSILCFFYFCMLILRFVAIHTWVPLCRYTHASCARFAPSNDQTDIQRSSCRIGQPISPSYSWREMSPGDYRRYWLAVSKAIVAFMGIRLKLLSAYQLFCHMRVFAIFLMGGILHSGQAMIQRH